jgi:hypothetical protein
MNNINIKTIFDAIPTEMVADKYNVFQKSKQKNLIYIIIGYKSVETNQYLVTYYILRTPKGGKAPTENVFWETKSFYKKTEVMTFIYDFLDKFSDHGRAVNTLAPKSKILNFEIFIEEVTLWIQKIIDIFGNAK